MRKKTVRFAANLDFTPVTKMRKRAIEKMRLHHFVCAEGRA